MNKNAEIWFFRITAALFLLYILLRAWLIPITIDEVSTCINHVPRRVFDMLTYQADATPNNHVLNTLLIKILTGIFRMEYITVRIPAMIGGALYCWASWSIARRSGQVWLRVFAFLLFLCNPFVVEFFALARGYGLSVGLMMMAVWQTLEWLDSNRHQALIGAVVFAALSVEANFTLLNFYVPFLCLLLFQIFRHREGSLWYTLKPVCWTSGMLALLCYAPIAAMRKTDQFKFWGDQGFIKETMMTLVNSSTWVRDGNAFPSSNMLCWLIVAVSAGCWLVAGYRFWRYRFQLRFDILLSALFAGTVAFNILQFWLFKTPFLGARTALFFYPLFALQLFVLAGWLWENWGNKVYYYTIPVFSFAVLNFFLCANLYISREWWPDSASFEALNYLKQVYMSEHRKAPVSFDTSWEMFNSVQFHVEHNRSRWEVVAKLPNWHGSREYPKDTEYYLAISDSEAKPYLDAYDIVWRSPHGPMVLIRRKDDHPLPGPAK